MNRKTVEFLLLPATALMAAVAIWFVISFSTPNHKLDNEVSSEQRDYNYKK